MVAGLLMLKFLSTLSLRRATIQWEGMKSLSEVISIHALLAESDRFRAVQNTQINISIHALLAESDENSSNMLCSVEISIHALLAESDLENRAQDLANVAFLSTLSLRRATRLKLIWRSLSLFLSTLSLRRATCLWGLMGGLSYISIHALLAESDHAPSHSLYPRNISIHALLAESDPLWPSD